MSISLRYYQSSSIHSVFQAWRDGYRRVLLCCPTGSGKRYLALWLMDYAAQAGRKVLFVGNRRLLITQAQNDAEAHGINHGIIMADSCGGNAGSTNQIASLQTLESWYFKEKFSSEITGKGLPPANLIIVDECHQSSKKYHQLCQLYPDAKILGLTATPVGKEGRSMIPAFYDILIEGVKNSELIRNGLLVPTTVFAPSEPDIEGVRVDKGEYSQAGLGRAVQGCTVFADVFREWNPYQNLPTVAFVPGVPFGRHLVAQFNNRLGNPNAAELIEADTKPNDRERIIQAVREGNCRVLVSVDVLREGFDLPALACGIDLQPNNQLRTYWQKLGRVKRKHDGKDRAVWLDFSGNYWKFPHPDEDPDWPDGGSGLTTQEYIAKGRQEKGEAEPIRCPKCSLVRKRGKVCPGCGFQCQESVRKIRMGDGRLVEVDAKDLRKKEITDDQRLYNHWKSRLYAALHTGHTYGQCAALFRRETGKHPKDNWLGAFLDGSLDWKRRPISEFNKATLTAALSRLNHSNESG